MGAKRRGLTLFKNVILFNIICTLITSLFNQLIFYGMIDNSYRKDFIRFSAGNINLAFENIDRLIVESVFDIPAQYFSQIPSNQAVLTPMDHDISTNPTRIRELTMRLSEITKASPAVMGIDLYYTKTNMAITCSKNIHFFRNSADRDSYLPWYPFYEQSEKRILFTPLSHNNYPENRATLTYITSIPQYASSTPGIILAIHISPERFSEYIDQNSGSFIITDNNGNLIYESPASQTTSIYSQISHLLTPPPKDGTASTQTLHMPQGESFVLISAYSKVPGLRYYYATRYQSFFKDYQPILRLFFVFSLFIVLINIAAIVLISRRQNRAYLQRVISVSKQAGIDLGSNAPSIDESLEHLATTIHSLNNEVENARPLLYQNSVRALIFNRVTEETFKRMKPQLHYNNIYCAIIHTADDQNNLTLSQRLQTAANELKEEYRFLFTALESTELAVIAACPDDRLQDSLQALGTFLDLHLTSYKITVGCTHLLTESSIKDSFDEATLIDRYRYIYPDKIWLYYNDFHLRDLKNTGSHLKIFSQVERAILSGNEDELQKRFCYLIEAFKNGGYSIDYCISTLRDLVGLLHQMMENVELDTWIVLGYDIREYFKQIKNIDEFYEWVLSLGHVMITNMEERKKSVDSDLEEKILKLVEENLENDISLEFLSDRLGLRSDVLSRSFKLTVGKNYTEYIKDKKMERAVELLGQNCTVKNIAQRLGYNSTQYFIKVFKSTFGETPRQYQKNIQHKN